MATCCCEACCQSQTSLGCASDKRCIPCSCSVLLQQADASAKWLNQLLVGWALTAVVGCVAPRERSPAQPCGCTVVSGPLLAQARAFLLAELQKWRPQVFTGTAAVPPETRGIGLLARQDLAACNAVQRVLEAPALYRLFQGLLQVHRLLSLQMLQLELTVVLVRPSVVLSVCLSNYHLPHAGGCCDDSIQVVAGCGPQ